MRQASKNPWGLKRILQFQSLIRPPSITMIISLNRTFGRHRINSSTAKLHWRWGYENKLSSEMKWLFKQQKTNQVELKVFRKWRLCFMIYGVRGRGLLEASKNIQRYLKKPGDEMLENSRKNVGEIMSKTQWWNVKKSALWKNLKNGSRDNYFNFDWEKWECHHHARNFVLNKNQPANHAH